MTATIRRIAFALVVCALLGASASAGVKRRSVSIGDDVTVGDTVVKKGDYEITFDDQAQELKILKGGKVVAQTPARVEEGKGAGRYKSAFTTVKDADGARLLSGVSIGGKYVVISSGKIAAATAGAARDTQ